MNNWYQAILDLEAGPDEASFLALKVVTRLTTAGIIAPTGGTSLNGSGINGSAVNGAAHASYMPGKNFIVACSGASGTITHDLENVGGMDAETGPWVNNFGLASLEVVACPTCGTKFGSQNGADVSRILGGFVDASDAFYSGVRDPKVKCPVCFGDIPATHWNTVPHLGYCYLAFIFWNWPPFSEWEIDIPRVVSDALKHKIVLTYGSH